MTKIEKISEIVNGTTFRDSVKRNMIRDIDANNDDVIVDEIYDAFTDRAKTVQDYMFFAELLNMRDDRRTR